MFPISFQRVLAVACLACGPWAVHAASLVFSPSSQQVDLGQVASVDVTVTGLSNQRVGAYDFFVVFDASRLSFRGAGFGAALGRSSGDSLGDVVEEPERVNLSEVSQLLDLSGLQSGSSDLLLFTLSFLTTAIGTANLSFEANILVPNNPSGFLGDDASVLLPITAADPGSITIVTEAPPPPPPASGPVVTPPNPVPEPSSLALLLAAVAAAAAATVGRRAGPQRG